MKHCALRMLQPSSSFLNKKIEVKCSLGKKDPLGLGELS
jgi:hypothetical protein